MSTAAGNGPLPLGSVNVPASFTLAAAFSKTTSSSTCRNAFGSCGLGRRQDVNGKSPPGCFKPASQFPVVELPSKTALGSVSSDQRLVHDLDC